MKNDIQTLMGEHAIDAIFITGAGHDNPAMVYMTGVMEFDQADLILQAGINGILFHYDMERDGAARSGYSLHSLDAFNFGKLMKEADGNRMLATALRYREQFSAIGLTSGRVVVYGQMDVGECHYILSKLEEYFPDLHFVMDPECDILRIARSIKGDDEIAHIRHMGEVTVEIVDSMIDFITSHGVKNDYLIKKNGDILTLGDVKKWMRLQLIDKNAQEQGTILSIGRDAGVPHNEGNAESPLKLGETIILDAFFQELGGGYFYDFTRTWCLGYASEEIQRDYEVVKNVHQKIANEVRAGQPFSDYQKMACELFAQQGYATSQTVPNTKDGYVHGLGHGIGLEVHELPMANVNIPENILKPGMVITIEPGLYFPEKGYGIRIEDSYEILKNGTAKKLVDYPWELIIPVKEK